MKSIITFCLICIFQFAGYTHHKSGTLAFADSVAKAGNAAQAFVEYERVCYLAIDNVVRTKALLRKAALYATYGNSEDALRTTKRVVLFGLSDSLIYTAHYQSATYAFVNLDFALAESELLQVETMLPEAYSVQSAPLYALVLNNLAKWSEAEEKLIKYIDQSPEMNELDSFQIDSITSEIHTLYQEKNQPRYKDPDKAFLFSSLLPASGQIWVGRPLDAAFTILALATGLGGVAFGVFIAKYYVSSAIAGITYLQRFYGANQKRTKYLAERRNYRKRLTYNEQLESLIFDLPK